MRSERIAILDGESRWSATATPGSRHDASHLPTLLGASVAAWKGSDLGAEAGPDLLIWLGPDGSGPATCAALLEAVGAGASLLVTLDGRASVDAVQPLLEAAGFRVGGRDVRVSDRSRAHRTTETFAVSATDHAAVRGVGEVVVHGALPVEPGAGGASLLRAPTGESLGAVSPLGRGRVAVIGDTDFLARPFVGRSGNAQLLTGLAAWLLGSDPRPTKLAALTDTIPPSPAAEGDVLSRPGSHVVDCAPFRAELEQLAAEPLPHPYAELEEFLEAAELSFHRLPRALRESVLRFRRDSNQYGALIVRGLPCDPELPPTPADAGRAADKPTHISELWVSAFAAALGDPISFAPLKEGEVFMNICPTPRNEGELSSESSRVTLDYHTELAYHPHTPSHLLLLCLRPDHERVARTFFSCSRQVVGRLSPVTLAQLFEPRFRAEVDISFRGRGGAGEGIPLPIFHGDPYDPMMNFDGDLIAGIDERAQRAYDELGALLGATQMHVELDRGDLLVLDNRRATHGRSRFIPRYDGRDRWLQRVYVGDLRSSIDDRRPGSRVIETEFVA